MSTVATLPFVFSEGGLPRYLSEIQKFPLLTASQEVTYAKRWREHGDREAAYYLVTSHLRLAAKIAMKYRRYGLPIPISFRKQISD
jgi:RNA polymerase sigma-32 factor